MKNIKSFHKALAAKETSCLKEVQQFLAEIETRSSLNAFLEVFKEEALERAEALDAKFASGEKTGRLAGVVIAIKDVIVYKGHICSASSKMLENYEAIYHATAIEKLLAEDAIIIGRLNCDEFAMGSSNENSAFGPVLNAQDENKIPGGSSGGSAVAVQAGLCHVSLGSDTGGSVRMPASYCGTVGIKPGYGRISRHGLIAYASSFDQIGVFASNVEDAALITGIISGVDEFDSTLLNVPSIKTAISNWEKPAKIAVLKEAIESEALDSEVKAAFEDLFERLKAEGHQIELVSFPYLKQIVPTYYILTTAEAASNLNRYDGIHYGHRSSNAKDLEETYVLSRSEAFGDEVKKRIMIGNFILTAGYYDAYYTKAQKVRRLIEKATKEILSTFDFIMGPTTIGTAFNLGEKSEDPIEMYLSDIFTVQANLAGIGAISLPLFKSETNEMPFGLQLMCGTLQEEKMFSFSQYLMQL